MKLDRNKNPDGRGKYALINLRKNTVEWGCDDQFFVIKYKDRFAAAALFAYANAVREFISNLGASRFSAETLADLTEYANEIEREAKIAKAAGVRIPD